MWRSTVRTGLGPTILHALLLFCFLSLPLPSALSRSDSQDPRPSSVTVVLDDNYPPYIFRDQNGDVQGFLVDEWRLWSQTTGVEVNLVATDWNKARQIMLDGGADIIDTMFFNEERAALYDFTPPYARLDVPVFFHKSLGGITDVQSLHGFTIGAKAGDACIDVLRGQGIATIQEFDSYEDIIKAAGKGTIKVFCVDKPPALYYLYKFNLDDVFHYGFILYSGEFHRAVNKGRKDLLRLVEDGFAAIESQKIKSLEQKWLGTPIYNSEVKHVLIYTILLVAAFSLALFFFNITLRRKVRTKTQELNYLLEALRKSEERYREFIEGTDNIVTQVDANGRITYVNQVAAKLFGYSQKKCLDKLATDFVIPEERARTQHAFTHWIQEKRNKATFENKVLSASGDVRALVWNINLHYEEEKISYINSIAQDITDLLYAQEQLRESRKFLEEVIDNIPDPVFVKDEEHRFVLANTALCSLIRTSREKAIGGKDHDFLPAKEADWFVSRDKLVLETGRMDISEEPLTDPEGRSLTLLTKKNRYVDAAGRRYIVGVIRDVTERKRMQEILVQSEKMMSIGGLAAGMAHEINNPLSAILQSLQVVQNRLITTSAANIAAAEAAGCTFEGIKAFLMTRGVFAMLQGARDAGYRAAKIVSSMLEFSRKGEFRRLPVDINALLDKAIDLCSKEYDVEGRYDFNKIVIERVYDKQLPLVPCAEPQIEQVVVNILRNAAQALFLNDTGKQPRMTLRTALEADSVRIELQDNGPGIPDAAQKHIFEPFYTTKGPRHGTGLGLSVSYFIITENHKGSIEVQSQPGNGALFIIKLPLAPQSEEDRLDGET